MKMRKILVLSIILDKFMANIAPLSILHFPFSARRLRRFTLEEFSIIPPFCRHRHLHIIFIYCWILHHLGVMVL